MIDIENYQKYQIGQATVYFSQSCSDEMSSIVYATYAGSVNDPEGKEGLAHFTEHMLFNGTVHFKKSFLENEMYRFGVSDLNAFTSSDWLAVTATCFSRFFEQVFGILFELINLPDLNEIYLEKERKIILQEYGFSRSSLSGVLSQEYLKYNYFQNNYTNPTIGYPESIQSINISDIRKFHGKFIKESFRQVVVVRSKLSWTYLESLFKKYFSSGKLIKPYFRKQSFLIKQKNCIMNAREFGTCNFNQSGLIFSVPLKSSEMLKLSVISKILSGTLGSRLLKELREKRGLTYSVSSCYEILGTTCLFFIFTEFSNIKNLKEIQEVILDSFSVSVSEDELNSATVLKKISLLKSESTVVGNSVAVLNRLQAGISTDFNDTLEILDNFRTSDFQLNSLQNGAFFTIIS